MNTERPEHIHLSQKEQEFSQLYFLSFYFSQGEEGLHATIYRHLIQNNILPDIEIQKELPHFMKHITPPNNHDFHGRRTGIGRISHLTEQWKIFQSVNEYYNDKGKLDLAPSIIGGTIELDLEFQYRQRPGREGIPTYNADSKDDPHKSIFRLHGVTGKDTHHAEFNRIFLTGGKALQEKYAHLEDVALAPLEFIPRGEQTIPETIRSTIGALPMEKKVHQLISSYKRNHPGESFFPKPTNRD